MHMGDENAIISSSPKVMYRETYVEGLLYLELLQLLSVNVCLDISVIHLFAMYFYELSNSNCAFFNPNDIYGDICIKNRSRTKQHIIDVYTFHCGKNFFLAPYYASGHWILFIISPLNKKGYIVDSINKNKSQANYAISFIIEEVFGARIDWEMI
ncbi:hypothetical protein R6Q57_018396 [Mikania cordata]